MHDYELIAIYINTSFSFFCQNDVFIQTRRICVCILTTQQSRYFNYADWCISGVSDTFFLIKSDDQFLRIYSVSWYISFLDLFFSNFLFRSISVQRLYYASCDNSCISIFLILFSRFFLFWSISVQGHRITPPVTNILLFLLTIIRVYILPRSGVVVA